MTIDSALKRRVRTSLLRWYDRSHRDLPWRRTRDPYAILTSELMLQQTQVSSVLGYYGRFMRAFPTMGDLARAPMDRVLKVWEGLGYYSRARNFKYLADIVMKKHGGAIPSDVDALMSLPGVGRSTAGAVASLAFGKPEPILDGNVKRVLARLFAVRGDPYAPETQRMLWRLSSECLSPSRPADFNQGIMELGATVCLPKGPACLVCPLRRDCRAARAGLQDVLPEKRARRTTPHYEVAVGILRRGQRIYIQRRPDQGLLGGLWELPGGKRAAGETLESCVRREVKEETGYRAIVACRLEPVRHAYSHFKVTIHPFICRISGRGKKKNAPHRWITLDMIEAFAFPAANKKIFDALMEAIDKRPEARSGCSIAAENAPPYTAEMIPP